MPAVRRPSPSQALESAVTAFNRNPWSTRKLRLVSGAAAADEDEWRWDEDGMRTKHPPHFVEDERFRRAYARAVRAGTFDYGVRWRVHTLLWAAELAARQEGAFVECGTARGYMASAICDYLDWADRPFYLLDTFESTDRPERLFYADAGPEPVRNNFMEWPSVRLVVGRVPDTLDQVDVDRVAFLHVDMNVPEPEEAAVRHFWPLLPPGGVIVFDDYGFASYPESRASADRLSVELGFTILASATGQGVVIKS